MKYLLSVTALSFLLLGAGCASTTAVNSDGQQEPTPAPTTAVVTTGTKLDLSNQGLTQVSQDVFKQTDLIELDLSGNALTGALPAEIRFLSQLEVLDVSDNDMTGVPAEVGQLKRLKVLDLSNNQLTGLPLELGQLTQLETLDLRGNAYSTSDLEQIRKTLTKTTILVD